MDETKALFGGNRGYIRMKKRLCRDKTKAIFGTNKSSVKIKKDFIRAHKSCVRIKQKIYSNQTETPSTGNDASAGKTMHMRIAILPNMRRAKRIPPFRSSCPIPLYTTTSTYPNRIAPFRGECRFDSLAQAKTFPIRSTLFRRMNRMQDKIHFFQLI
ncbi:hypothetical protein [Bacteroides pyogenes]|uniref:hypothetical protein n=1 Tax=Bacteroides pyogenes TaxID=310300 RepID=UPI00068ECEEF|nr:hypothetical protein [Bacteroides pyogenes]MBB3894830.1 hypothetical protein [Bacteroides pyogenes]SUV33042.1 Uncharacterised protein [Bacteroides pyogenes]